MLNTFNRIKCVPSVIRNSFARQFSSFGNIGLPTSSFSRTMKFCRQNAKLFTSTAKTETPSLWRSIISYPKRRPFPFQVAVATIKTSIADVLVQKFIEGNEEIDIKRNLVFVAFGGLYLGGFQWFIYVTCFRRWFPGMDKFAQQPLREKLKNKEGLRSLYKQVAFDNFIHYTFIYFPVFYVFKEVLQEQKPGEATGPLAIFPNGLAKYKENFWEDNINIWMLWIPGDLIIYALPIWLRLPANHFLSLIWCCILSYVRGAAIEEEPVPTLE